jgi:mitotic spindle assembly checkpoint protein MAD2
LKGSAALVAEFFGYSINSILYQRGIYPPDTFTRVEKYGLHMLITRDEGLKNYLSNVLKQLKEWLITGTVQKLVVVICNADTNETLERWAFDILTELPQEGREVQKSENEITKEIQAIIRQICASVTFLPLLEAACTFDLLVYTDNKIAVPLTWEESDPRYITNSQSVRLRSFSTKIHQVDTMVSYTVDH